MFIHDERGGIVSVEKHLGLATNLEQVLTGSWPGWVARRPVLGAVAEPSRLRSWLQDADPALADEVLHGLAWLASVEGADDRDAAAVLAWLMVPGASFTARQLRSLSKDIDHVVASELWILVRTFPLRRRKVRANLMRDLRSRVLVVCEAPASLRRTDPTWAATVCSTDVAAVQALAAHREPSALEELVDVLDWACEQQVIRALDRALLLMLVDASQDLHLRVSASHGLLSTEATAQVAARLGVSERTVRRRAQRSIRAVAAAAPGYTRVA